MVEILGIDWFSLDFLQLPSGPGYWILYSGLGFWYGTVGVFLVDTKSYGLMGATAIWKLRWIGASCYYHFNPETCFLLLLYIFYYTLWLSITLWNWIRKSAEFWEFFFVHVDALVAIMWWNRLIPFINNVGELGDRILVPWRRDTHFFNSK